VLVPITTVAELGLLLRATRKSQGARLDDVAGSAGVGPVFLGAVERGKESVQMGLVLRLLQEVGLKLQVDVPQSAIKAYEELKVKGVRPLPSRRPSRSSASATRKAEPPK
jgi:transcriptional regulator with XRE-family HTH domain